MAKAWDRFMQFMLFEIERKRAHHSNSKIRNGCFKGSDQIRSIPSVQSKCIMKTCRCNEYSLKSQNYLVKLRYTG